MNPERVVSIALVAACVFAVGVSATTLESSLETDPDDVINVDFRTLPIGGGQTVASVEDEIEQNGAGPTEESKSADGAATSQVTDRVASRAEQELRVVAGAPGDSWLRDLLWLLALLGLVASTAALGYRYRERLRALLPETGRGPTDEDRPWPPAAPGNDIERAWVGLVGRLEFDRPRAATPGECEAAALERGMDPEAIRAIVRTFEEVRYGGAPLTEERRRRATDGLRRVEAGVEGDA